MKCKRRSGFTLIELLTVIAIIGILAGILIPTVGSARISAMKAKTKAQFGNWGAAMELYKQEYGFYPNIATSNKINTANFMEALVARTVTGSSFSSSSRNPKLISFYTVSDADLSKNSSGAVDGSSLIVDAFENDEIAVFVDDNLDGIVEPTNASLKAGTGAGKVNVVGSPTLENVRAGVVFYSAGKGSQASDYVYSWK